MSVVQSTGPGIWSDAVLEYLDATYGAVFDDKDFFSDELVKFGPEKAREETLHVGSVLMLPVRAFGMNSGGYSAKPDHKIGDIFAQHYFQGSWKNKQQPGAVVEDPTVYSPCHRHRVKSHELICGLSESASAFVGFPGPARVAHRRASLRARAYAVQGGVSSVAIIAVLTRPVLLSCPPPRFPSGALSVLPLSLLSVAFPRCCCPPTCPPRPSRRAGAVRVRRPARY